MDYSYSYDYGSTAASGAAMAGFMGIYMVIMLAVCVISIVALWKIFARQENLDGQRLSHSTILTHYSRLQWVMDGYFYLCLYH